MGLRQLRYFRAIARTGSFSAAAVDEFVVQSALSRQIRKLEEELGVRLFERTTRMVRLTDEGARLLEYADRVLADVDLVVAEADALRGVVRGKVAVGMMECPPASLDMAVLLSEFHTDHPGVEVALRSGGSDRMLDDVRAGDLDFAILGLPPTPLDDRLTVRTLLVEDLVGLVEVDHRLRTRARAASLVEEVFVDFPPGYGLREQTDHCFAEAGIDRKVGFEVVRVEEMIRFATLGLGIAVLPRSIAAAIGRRARRPRIVDITGADLRRTVALVHRQDGPRSAAARAFFDLAATPLPTPSDRAA